MMQPTMTSPEGDTIWERTIALIASNSVEKFGDSLVAKGLIDEQAKSNIITAHGIGNYDKTSRLMSAARGKIENILIEEDPSRFPRLIAVVKDSAPSEDIVEELKQEYRPISPAKRYYRRGKRLVLSVINLASRGIFTIAIMGFALSCIVLNWTHVQDYVWNACTDLNVKNLWDTPGPTHFQLIKRQTELMTISSKFGALRQQDGAQGKTVVVYIVGPPAYGKTQLARQFAEEYYARNVRSYIFRTLVVASVDATSELSLLGSYTSLAKKLKVSHIPASNSMEETLLNLGTVIAAELKDRQHGWLLVLDNLTLQLKRNKNGQ